MKDLKSPRLFNPRLIFWWLSFFILFVLIKNSFDKKVNEVPSSEIKARILSGEIQKIVFKPADLSVKWYESAKGKKQVQVFVSRAAGQKHYDELYKLAEEKGIPFDAIASKNDFWSSFMINMFFIAVFIAIFFFFTRKMAGTQSKISEFSRTKAKRYSSDKKTTFADVAGCDEAKEELQEIVEFLKNPAEFSRLGAKVPKGVLLYGAPGTGKTLLARAVAGEAGVAFLSASGSEFIEMFVGVGASRVRDLFNNARKLAPCIIFIDEIDAVGKKRGVAIGGGHDEREQTLDQMLAELDGFDQNCGIIVIAATNRPDILDEALVRPGRFDRQVMVPKPDLRGREAILKIHARNIKVGSDVNLLDIAKDTIGMVGADLENIINEAVLLATRRKKEFIEQSDLSEAVDKVVMGPSRKSTKLSHKEKITVAFHEAGHVLIAKLFAGADPVHKVTIIPRGQALGFTKQLPEDDRNLSTLKQLKAIVAVLLGGRAAEELFLKEGEITNGASNDLQRATAIVKKMVYEWGMSEKAGLAVYKENNDFWGNSIGLDASDAMKQKLEGIMNEILSEIYKEVIKHLTEKKSKFDALVNALLEKETLNAEEIEKIFSSAQ